MGLIITIAKVPAQDLLEFLDMFGEMGKLPRDCCHRKGLDTRIEKAHL
jgi:hypothetical protein